MTSKPFLVSALAFALFSAAAAADPPPARALRIGIVDLTVIFQDYKAIPEYVEEMNRALRENHSRLERLDREISALRRSRQEYALGTPERLAKEEELHEKERVGRMLAMETRTKENTLRSRMYLRVYEETMGVVEAYAREHGLDMVLKQQSLQEFGDEELAGISFGAMLAALSSRSVLFNRPEFDITSQILEAMNAAHDRRKGAGETAP